MDNSNANKSKTEYVAVCCTPSAWWAAFWGIVLISLGGLSLLGTVIPLQHVGRYILPAILILWGGAILLNLRQKRA